MPRFTLPVALTLSFVTFGLSACGESAEVDGALGGTGGSAGDSSLPGTGGAGGAGTGGASGISDEPADLQYFGRWSEAAGGGREASWGAVYVKARFTGASLTLLLEDAGNEYEFRIDDGELTRLSPDTKTEYALAEGLPDGEHSFELYRRTGGSFGKTIVRGVRLDEGKSLLAPFARAGRSLEFIGDSITVGYGNEGTGSTSRETENGYLAYGPVTARQLAAEWSVIAHSGQGLFRNLGEEKADVGASLQMPEEFLLAHFPSVAMSPWDFSTKAPDAVVITLGTNDFSWKVWNVDPGPDWEPTEEEFVGAYRAFLGTLREKYPLAEVFAVGTLFASSTNQFGVTNEYICTAVSEQADPKMHCVDPGYNGPDGAWLSAGSDFIGDWTHPTVAGHQKIADKLAAKIAGVMGW